MTSRVCIILLLLSRLAAAQFDGASHPVRVQLDFTNGVCDASTRVRLSGLALLQLMLPQTINVRSTSWSRMEPMSSTFPAEVSGTPKGLSRPRRDQQILK